MTLASTALRLRLFTQRPCDSRPYDAPKVRFSATLEEETEVEVGLVLWKRATPETQNRTASPSAPFWVRPPAVRLERLLER